ncbi:MAG: hypothetical protein ACXWVV_04190 [Kaistella sp.]
MIQFENEPVGKSNFQINILKRYKFTFILCTAFLVICAFFLYKYLNSGKDWEKGSQMSLNRLVKDVEYYKLENGRYPDSLQQLLNKADFVLIYDPLQSIRNKKERAFFYKNFQNKYFLFSVGVDAIPFTKDDIYPTPNLKLGKIGWTKPVKK